MRARRVRRFDKGRGCYVYDIGFSGGVELTDRTVKVGEAFGLGLDGRRHLLYDDFELRLGMGDVCYITGDSGSGKSVLLRALREDLGDEVVVMGELPEPDDVPLVDAVGGSFREALALLGRVGLGDAYLFLRRYGELSEGQRYRFRLAQMLESGKGFWMCDEFCSLLDRTTARIVAYNVQRHARRVGATLVVATSHTDLVGDLDPDIRVVKGDHYYLRHCHQFALGTSYGSVIGYVKRLQDNWSRLVSVNCDQTGVGEYIVEDMRRAGVRNVNGVTFTEGSKEAMATALKERMRTVECPECGWTGFVENLDGSWKKTCPNDDVPISSVFHIPYDQDLFNDLNTPIYTLGKTGKIQFSHASGTHDDMFWAVTLSMKDSRGGTKIPLAVT